MTEKWLQGNRKPLRNLWRGPSAHYGKPVKLFKDSDKDGVMNVFDCKPYNKRKQDVISPPGYGGGMMDMYGRQEQARQQREYQRQLEELRRLEEARLKEVERLSNVQVINQGETRYITQEGSAQPYIWSDKAGGYVPLKSTYGKEQAAITIGESKTDKVTPSKEYSISQPKQIGVGTSYNKFIGVPSGKPSIVKSIFNKLKGGKK